MKNNIKEDLDAVLVEYLNNISIDEQNELIKELQDKAFKTHFLFQLEVISKLISAKFLNNTKMYSAQYIEFLTTKSFFPFHPLVIAMQKLYLKEDYIGAIVNELSAKNPNIFNCDNVERKVYELQEGFKPFWS